MGDWNLVCIVDEFFTILQYVVNFVNGSSLSRNLTFCTTYFCVYSSSCILPAFKYHTWHKLLTPCDVNQ